MKKIVLLFIFAFSISNLFAQPIANISSGNMSSTVSSAPQEFQSRSFRVHFEIQNDTVVLIDSFITDQSVVDSFLHSDFQLDTIFIDYTFPGNLGGGVNSCGFNFTTIDTIIAYEFKLFHKDSFQNKVIRYKENLYSHSNLGTPNWSYTPDEYDFSQNLSIIKGIPGSAELYGNNECPLGITVTGDSIFIQTVRYFGSGVYDQLLREDAYSTPDSFNLRLQQPCANAYPTYDGYQCNKIYIGDTSASTIDVKMFSLHSAYPTSGFAEYWFHYEKNNNVISTNIVAPLAAVGLKLDVQSLGHLNDLHWSTISEKNTSHCNIMRSSNGIDFNLIGTRSAAGDSELPSYYNFQDTELETNTNYYYKNHLFDIDGSFTSSNVVKIAANNLQSIIIYPNPATDILNIAGLESEDYHLQISTMEGRVLMNENVVPSNSSHQTDISSLAKGIYNLSITNIESGVSTFSKIIKQ